MSLLRPGKTDALEAIITADGAGRVVFWSRGAERIFRYSQSEIAGQPLTILMPERYRAAHEEGVARVFRERQSRLDGQTLRLEGLRNGGETFPMELTLATWISSEQIYFTGIVRDLTESDVALRLHRDIYFDVTTILTESPRFDDAAEPLLRLLCESMSFIGAAAWLMDGDRLRCHRFFALPGVAVEEFRHSTESTSLMSGLGLPGKVFADGQPAWISDAAVEADLVRGEAARRSGIRGALAFPILAGREVLGVLEFYSTAVREPDERLLKLMTYIGSQIGLFISRERMETALRESESRYRVLFENNVAGLYRSTLDGRILEVNEAFVNMFGYASAEEVKALNAADLYARADDRVRIVEAIRERGEVSEEILGRLKDGSTRWMLISFGAVSHDEHRETIFDGSIIDISKRKGAEDELVRAMTMLNRAQEVAKIGSFEENFLTGEAWWSNEMYRISGLGPQMHTISIDLVVPEDRERLRSDVIQAAKDQIPVETTYHIRRPDGEQRLVRMLGEIESGQDGSPVSLVGTVQDITVENRLLQDRERLQHQIEQVRRVSSLGQLAASMAHEFNNVLMGIQPHVEILRRNIPPSPLVDRALQHVLDSVRRGSRITEEILTFTRPRAPDLKPVSVRAMLERLVEVDLPRIEVRIEQPDAEVWVLGDAAQLDQVLTNLSLNARDAMPDGGTLCLAVEHNTELDGLSTVVLSMSDTGTGMPPEVQEHIFEPLFTTKRRGGTGLGLAITFQIITSHGGTVTVSSVVGRGSTFRVALRAADPPGSSVAQRAPERIEVPDLERVLLVEDDEAVSSGLGSILSGFGLQVEVVPLGSDAERATESFRPDAVILDVGLPDISGWDVYTKLRHRFPKLPIVISSGHAFESDTLRHDRAAAILRKPYATEELFAALQRVVRGR